ncbi:MAG: peptidyl-prolyl cis-trans isomerase [Neisseriaceae bacterium]|nr:peptidyl-prolyl cis-trans isomerase [Neisseriaceae bacterium]
MNIKPLLFVLASATALAVYAADAPKIDDARVNLVIEQYEATGGKADPEQLPEIRKQITQELQRAEVLKNAALQAGVDKQPEVQLAHQNFEAHFYAGQYFEYLKKNMRVPDEDLREIYARLGREVKIQMAAFKTAEEVTAAQDKLRKGMSFGDLIASMPEQPASPPDFINPQILPPEFASAIDNMEKGKITDKAVEFQGLLYLFKLTDTRKGTIKVPPFEEIKDRLEAQRKDELVREKVQQLFRQHGLEEQ